MQNNLIGALSNYTLKEVEKMNGKLFLTNNPFFRLMIKFEKYNKNIPFFPFHLYDSCYTFFTLI